LFPASDQKNKLVSAINILDAIQHVFGRTTDPQTEHTSTHHGTTQHYKLFLAPSKTSRYKSSPQQSVWRKLLKDPFIKSKHTQRKTQTLLLTCPQTYKHPLRNTWWQTTPAILGWTRWTSPAPLLLLPLPPRRRGQGGARWQRRRR